MSISVLDPLITYTREEDAFTGVHYNGVPFTGSLIDGNEVIEYVSGAAHGTATLRFPEGTISE